MSQKPPLCKLCSEPCVSRPDRPGKFRHLCDRHWHEYKLQKARESYARHKDKRVQATRNYRIAHPKRDKEYRDRPEVKAYQRAYQPRWNATHPEKRLEYERRYIENNREKVNAKVKRRSQRKRAAKGHCSEDQWQDRIDFYGRRCYLCGCDWDALPKGQKHQEHVIPVSRGGTNWPSNFRPACGKCNSIKHDKMPDQLVA
jgi:HNH endonuclease